MQQLITTFQYQEQLIPVYFERKQIKNSYARFKDNAIFISANMFISQQMALSLARQLFDKIVKKGILDRVDPIGSDYYYLFGKRIPRFVSLSETKLDAKLKKALKEYLAIRVPYYEKIMGIEKAYQVSVRKMKSRYGSNALDTHKLTFNLVLVHYDYPIIDSVIVHELAHHFVRGHDPKFYQKIKEFFPEYKKYDKLLKKGIFHE